MAVDPRPRMEGRRTTKVGHAARHPRGRSSARRARALTEHPSRLRVPRALPRTVNSRPGRSLPFSLGRAITRRCQAPRTSTMQARETRRTTRSPDTASRLAVPRHTSDATREGQRRRSLDSSSERTRPRTDRQRATVSSVRMPYTPPCQGTLGLAGLPPPGSSAPRAQILNALKCLIQSVDTRWVKKIGGKVTWVLLIWCALIVIWAGARRHNASRQEARKPPNQD